MKGNVEYIADSYNKVKDYIEYDAFQTVMIAIVFFLIFMKLWEEIQKNIGANKRFDMGAYWGQIRIYIIVCIISTFSGSIFRMTEALCTEMQEMLMHPLGGDSSTKSIDTMTALVKEQENRVNTETSDGLTFDSFNPLYMMLCKLGSTVAMGIGIFIYKYTYTFFIVGRYMWLLMLELIAPIAIVLVIHDSTRSYFYTWVKNMIICYLLIPMFLLADKFSNEVALGFLKGAEFAGSITTILVIGTAVWIKIKLFSVVKQRSGQLF